jgi:hypothetical protein
MTTVRNHGYSWKGFFVDNGMFPRNASETTSTGLSMWRSVPFYSLDSSS